MESKKKVSQNFDTPWIRDDLITAIGHDEEKDGGRQIIKEFFSPPTGTLNYMTKFIDSL